MFLLASFVEGNDYCYKSLPRPPPENFPMMLLIVNPASRSEIQYSCVLEITLIDYWIDWLGPHFPLPKTPQFTILRNGVLIFSPWHPQLRVISTYLQVLRKNILKSAKQSRMIPHIIPVWQIRSKCAVLGWNIKKDRLVDSTSTINHFNIEERRNKHEQGRFSKPGSQGGLYQKGG